MKRRSILLVIVISLIVCITQLFAQKPNGYMPTEIFVPQKPTVKFYKAGKSFYQQKENWQQIIDSTWGPGLSLDKKFQIFNSYTNSIIKKYPGFPNLDYDWDSLKLYYYNQIDSMTSRGKFAAIMSHLAFKLREHHSWAKDLEVIYTPLNPGTPLLIVGGFNDVSHFGAVLTTLPDSTCLVLRVVENHPLNLKPGDLILGYEGVPWKNLVEELLEAGLPLAGNSSGSKSAYLNSKLISVGMNWHLFNTIDVKKYSTGEVQSLGTSDLLLLDSNSEVMINNEQLEIPNIPFPKYKPQYPMPGPGVSEVISSGILEDNNIGYVYLCHESSEADNKLKEAINSFSETDGLIIDMRYNGGGGNELVSTLKMLFNSNTLTLEDAYRCSPNNWDICPAGNANYYEIKGDPDTFYEKPIAILLGPGCVSMGDFIAYKLKLHPNVKFFGKSSSGSMGLSTEIYFNGWELLHHISETCYASDYTTFLDQKEFPIDYPVWFNQEDVANGYDTVIEEAKKYIRKLSKTISYSEIKEISDIQFLTEDIGWAFLVTEDELNNGLYKTIDRGNNWNFNYNSIEFLSKFNSIGKSMMYAGISGFHFTSVDVGYYIPPRQAVYKTTDGGYSWSEIYSDTSDNFISSFLCFSDDISIISKGGSWREGYSDPWLVYATDGAKNWKNIDIENNGRLLDITENRFLYLGNIDLKDESEYLLSKFDLIDSIWYDLSGSLSDFENRWIDKLQFVNKDIGFMMVFDTPPPGGYEEISGYFYKTIDGGSSWTIKSDFKFQNIGGKNHCYMKFFNENLGIVAGDSWIMKTSDGGDTFDLLTETSPILTYTYSFVSEKVAYGLNSENDLLTTNDSGIDWGIVTDVRRVDETKEIEIHNFKLDNNYPNPFNPSTMIKYTIPKHCAVTLKVFDVLGSEVGTLVNKEQPQGNYEVEFDGQDITSGIYFYTIKAGQFVETKKMILLK